MKYSGNLFVILIALSSVSCAHNKILNIGSVITEHHHDYVTISDMNSGWGVFGVTSPKIVGTDIVSYSHYGVGGYKIEIHEVDGMKPVPVGDHESCATASAHEYCGFDKVKVAPGMHTLNLGFLKSHQGISYDTRKIKVVVKAGGQYEFRWPSRNNKVLFLPDLVWIVDIVTGKVIYGKPYIATVKNNPGSDPNIY